MIQAAGGNRRGLSTVRAVVILAGFLAFLPGIRIFGRSYSMTRWPVTPGRVTSSAILEKGRTKFEAAVGYEYILAGRVRRGRMPVTASTRQSAESVTVRYPVGREIAVGYNPGNTEESVLLPRIKWWSLLLALGGSALLLFGTWPRKP